MKNGNVTTKQRKIVVSVIKMIGISKAKFNITVASTETKRVSELFKLYHKHD